MTPAEFRAWLQSRQRVAHRPKDIALVNCSEPVTPTREPGDESDFAPVANLADRLQRSITMNRLRSGPVKYSDIDTATRAKDERIGGRR